MTLPTSHTRPAPTGSPHALQRFIHLVLRIGAGVVAFVLMVFALLAGLLLAVGVIAWAVVRGRKPAVSVFKSSYRRARHGASDGDTAQVVDVEVREVPEAGRR